MGESRRLWLTPTLTGMPTVILSERTKSAFTLWQPYGCNS